MATYTYTALNDSGKKVKGTLEADSESRAYEMIMDRGFIPDTVKRGGKAAKEDAAPSSITMALTKIKPQDLILFTKQFRTMLNAGVAVLQSLKVLETQAENPKLKHVISVIIRDITQGSTMYRAFSKHEKIFGRLYCNMLRAGEMSGTLIEVLERLIYIIDHEFKVKKDIQSALTYPIIVVVALVGAFIVLITLVLPNFIGMFQDQGIELPLPTRMCMAIHEFTTGYWPILVGALVGGGFMFITWSKTEKGRLAIDTFLLNLPILGDVFQKAAMSRFGSIFAILQSSGVTVLESVEIISGTIGNAAVSKQFESVKAKLEQGQGLSGPLHSAKYFTPMLVSMVAIGEESGQLEEMLKEVSVHYDYEVEYSVGKMSELLGPVLVACLAGVVGFFALAIMLPMLDLMQNAMAGR